MPLLLQKVDYQWRLGRLTMYIKEIIDSLPHNMQDDFQDPVTIQDAINYIEKLDFDEIINKITTKDPLVSHVWRIDDAHKAVRYYRNFLIINKKHGKSNPVIPPSMEMDEIWHHHILDTRRYINDCEAIFGRYFHHYPYFGARSIEGKKNLDETFLITQDLHMKEFGEYIYRIIDELYIN